MYILDFDEARKRTRTRKKQEPEQKRNNKTFNRKNRLHGRNPWE